MNNLFFKFEQENIKLQYTKFGRFLLYQQDVISYVIRNNVFWDVFLQDIIDQRCNTSGSAIDIGANLGFHTIYMSKRADKVYSVEPQHPVFLQLCGNLFLNEAFNVFPIEAAAYSRNTNFKIADNSLQIEPFQEDYNKIRNIAGLAMQPVESGQIKGIVLDDFIPVTENINFIKSDAQGADLDALIGLVKTIKRCKPAIVFEWEQLLSENIYQRKLKDYEDFFAELDYKMEIVHQVRPDACDYLCTPTPVSTKD